MPRISRIRVTNIQFDNGKKHLPDILFDTKGVDSLLLLANGGGKSLLIQLILQTVLPNTKMGERKIAHLLRHTQYTGHVAVEWLLDNSGDRRQFLCTGFCFSSGRSSDVQVRYFNYMFENRPGLDIEALPLVETDNINGMKRPMQYQRLKDWLRDNNIQAIESPGIYQERLKIYQIVPEEWKNIRDTNGSEGGVDKFFEKSRTTMQLLDNLLIPTVEQIIFQNETRKKELFNAFTEHREMLMQIPVIKQNLKDFAAIRDHAQGVVDEVAELDRLQGDLGAKTREMVRLARTFYTFSEEAKLETESLLQQQGEVIERKRELSWKSRSYEAFLKQLEHKAAQAVGKTLENESLRAKNDLDKAGKNERVLKAADYFNKVEKAETDENKYRTELDLMDRGQPELLGLLKEKKQVMRAAWDEKKIYLDGQLASREKELVKLIDEKNNITREQGQARSQEREMNGQLADVSNWLKTYDRARQELLPLVGPEEVIGPSAGLKNRENEFRSLEAKEVDTNLHKQELKSRFDGLGEEILSLKGEQLKVENEADQYRDRIAGFSKEEDSVRGLLSEQHLFIKSMFEQKEEVLLRLRDISDTVQQHKLSIQAELANLQEKWALLEGRDFYVPHHDLLKIKNRLEKSGIFVVLGSEWLAEQQLSEEEKEAVIRTQPGLPFAVLIEENQVPAVRSIMKQAREWTSDIPLLFLVKSEGILRTGGQADSFIPLWQEELFIYLPESFGVYTSAEFFNRTKSGLEEQISVRKGELSEVTARERNIISLQEKVKDFYQKYNSRLVDGWAASEQMLLGQAASLGGKIESGEKEKDLIKGEMSQLENTLQEITVEKQKLNSIIEKLKAYCRLHDEYPVKAKEQTELTNRLEGLNTKMAELQTRLVELAGEEEKEKGRIKEAKGLINSHKDSFAAFQLADVELVPVLNLSYDDVEVEVKGIIEQLSNAQKERQSTQTLMENAVKRKKEYLLQVEDTGIDEDWLRQNRRIVTREEILDAGKVVRERQDAYDKKKVEHEQAKIKTAKLEAVLEDIVDRIAADFSGQEPYDGFSEADHLLEKESTANQMDNAKKLLEELAVQIKSRVDWQKETHDAYETLEEKIPEEVRRFWDESVPYSAGEWESFKVKPRKIVSQQETELNNTKSNIEKQRGTVARQFDRYLGKLESTENPKVRQFIRDVKTIMEDNRLYDYDFVQDQFLRIFEGLEQYEIQFNNTLAECEINKKHLISLCLRRAGAVYESITEIPKNSRIKLYEREIQVIRLDWPLLDEAEGADKMNYYFEKALEDMQLWKQEGKDDDEINRRMEEKLKTRHLLDIIAPLDNCRVTVYKPRQESVIRHGKIDYAPWDEVSRWSGGEEYSIYITMFMIMLTHIRQQTEGRRDLWKVLVADNPFGKASSPHILDTVFQIAAANKIQLFCLTAHKQDDILKRFPVVYSLQLRNAYGKEIMSAEQMESGFYRLDTASGDGSQMMLPV
ncbi:hypothetical protein [Phosphitispora fastidiosa]|uniref:hypothetical protein n=1 Tax=Phosphitispora fastidiosa TaxID=2837202 RepID=UPI001E4A2D89|nr:hypothetical protein [Phosphitispora fastidiosa]MBU7005802.1 hypothetical protein [Phosphitispora fastidiosa]